MIHGRGYFKFRKYSQHDYYDWIKKYERIDRSSIRKDIKSFSYKPKVSIITPVYNVDPKWLNKCIESVSGQFYDNWEICLYDDASTRSETIECLKGWENKDGRIKIAYGKDNKNISGASNEALKLASGDFVALLDNDDELSLNALYEVSKIINDHPDADFIYSDEDKVDITGLRSDPFFKPNWSSDLLTSMMYTSHLGVYRKSIVDEIGGFRQGYEGSQDYDLVLRFIERTQPENIFHIAKILYHWRKIPGSTAKLLSSKDYAHDSARKALDDYLTRNNIEGTVSDGRSPGLYRIKRKILNNPKVSIIIPFRDQVEVLKRCVTSVIENNSYKNIEIILVNNQSAEKDTLIYLDTLRNKAPFKIIDYDRPFNYSAMNNYAVGKAQGEFILFLNNDTETINKEWLSAMVEELQRDEVGIVGSKLIYPNETIQHAGVVMGLGGVAGHAFRNFPKENGGYMNFIHSKKDYSAVTAACLMIKKEIFENVNGFDEENLPIAYNDVDLCLKTRELGFLVVYTPYSELYHYESLSRGDDRELKKTDPEKYKRVIREREYMIRKWKKYIENDPYYNVNLTRRGEDFSIKLSYH